MEGRREGRGAAAPLQLPQAKELQSSPARRMLQVAKPLPGSKAANQELVPCIQAKSSNPKDRQTVLGMFEGLW